METQDEETYRSEQIWWIDIAEGCHIPSDHESEQHLLYTITNQSLGYRLRYATPETVDRDGPVTIASQESVAGQGVQFWRISLVEGEASTPFGKCYTIQPSNYSPSDYKLVHHAYPGQTPGLGLQPPDSEVNHGVWELVNPSLAVPYGWVQLRNCFSENLLGHTSLSVPPTTVRPDHHASLENNQAASWGTHWSLKHWRQDVQTDFGVQPRRYYSLWNRLTKGCVASGETEYNEVPELAGSSVRISAKHTFVDPNVGMFHLEKTAEGRWIFMDQKGQILRESSRWFQGGLMVSIGDLAEGEENNELAKCWEIVEIPKYSSLR